MKLENKNRNNISAGECNTIEISYLKDIIQLKLKLTIHQIRLLSLTKMAMNFWDHNWAFHMINYNKAKLHSIVKAIK